MSKAKPPAAKAAPRLRKVERTNTDDVHVQISDSPRMTERTPAPSPEGGRYVYGIIESRVAKAVGKVLKERGTARNWATVRKLQALASVDAG